MENQKLQQLEEALNVYGIEFLTDRMDDDKAIEILQRIEQGENDFLVYPFRIIEDNQVVKTLANEILESESLFAEISSQMIANAMDLPYSIVKFIRENDGNRILWNELTTAQAIGMAERLRGARMYNDIQDTAIGEEEDTFTVCGIDYTIFSV